MDSDQEDAGQDRHHSQTVERTIRGYIKQLRLKMGCNTIAEAVSKAIRLKII